MTDHRPTEVPGGEWLDCGCYEVCGCSGRGLIAETASQESEPEMSPVAMPERCGLPTGANLYGRWMDCERSKGHDGPCAAFPSVEMLQDDAGWPDDHPWRRRADTEGQQ